jgi:predicted MFS family arabinose efflux permease
MQVRGAAMGVYNTLQSLGFFVGGWMGGSLVKSWGSQMLFLCCSGAMLLWWLVALPMQAPGRQAAIKTA